MKFQKDQLTMDDVSISDAITTIHADELPDQDPKCPIRLKNTSPLVEKMWRIALSDIEANIVTDHDKRYFGAGKAFGLMVFTRDIAISGLFGLNRNPI